MIYLDHSATTKPDDEVLDEILRVSKEVFSNPSSSYGPGIKAEQMVDSAKRKLLHILGSKRGRVYFTSGGTEANNLALLGVVNAHGKRRRHIVSTALEHSSVLDTLKYLETQGFSTTYLRPDAEGKITPKAVIDAVRDDTVLVSVMAVNNELGSVFDIGEIATECKRKNREILFHTDAVQAFCKYPLHPERQRIDLLSVTGHKIYAPKGIGALYVGEGVRISPLFHGGEQEDKVRPGTQNTAYIHGFGLAAERMVEHIDRDHTYVKALRDHFLKRFKGDCNSPSDASPYILNISTGVPSEVMLNFLAEREIYVSAGSACAKGRRSHVLMNAGFSPERVSTALRISFGRDNTIEEVNTLLSVINEGMSTLKRRK